MMSMKRSCISSWIHLDWSSFTRLSFDCRAQLFCLAQQVLCSVGRGGERAGLCASGRRAAGAFGRKRMSNVAASSNKKSKITSGSKFDPFSYTEHFYPVDEALSCLQKAVRRGQADAAAFFAGEMHLRRGSTETFRK